MHVHPLFHHSGHCFTVRIGSHHCFHTCVTNKMTTPEALDALRSSRSRIAKPVPRHHSSARPAGKSSKRTSHWASLSHFEGNEGSQPSNPKGFEAPKPDVFPSASDGAFNRTSDGVQVQETEVASRDWANYLGWEHPLRVIFVGHNPSDRSWDVCAPYAHGSNKFWKLVTESGLVPEALGSPSSFIELPTALGIGFVDLFVTRGSDARVVERRARKDTGWREDFLQRILAGTHGHPPKILACVSKTVAQQLLPKWKGDYGPIGLGSVWNLTGLERVQFWVLPSTSARAVLSHENRLAPFVALKTHLDLEVPWESLDRKV